MVGGGAAEAGAGSEDGETGPVLDAAEAFLLSGGDELTVTQETRGGIAVVSVKTEDQHEKNGKRTLEKLKAESGKRATDHGQRMTN